MRNLMKFYLLFFMLFAVVGNSFASHETDESEFKNNVMNYIKSEGYVPSLDEDGDIKFKSEGRTYYISISKYDDGCYVELTYYLDIEDSNQTKVRAAMDDVMRTTKFARIYTSSNHKMLKIETCWYCANIIDFRQFFSNGLDVVKLCHKKVKEKYND